MKFFLLASFVALACARPDFLYQGAGKHITVALDGTVTINNNQGQTVVFTPHIHTITGVKNFDIALTGAEIPTKHIQVYDSILEHSDIHQAYPWLFVSDDSFLKYGHVQFHTQGDLFVHIFRRYQGGVDGVTYHKILALVGRAVQAGLINHQIYQVLVGLEQHNWEGFGLEQFMPSVYGQDSQYESYPYNKYFGLWKSLQHGKYFNQYPYQFSQQYYGKNLVGNQLGDEFEGQYYAPQYSGVAGLYNQYKNYGYGYKSLAEPTYSGEDSFYKNYMFGQQYPQHYSHEQQYKYGGLNNQYFGGVYGQQYPKYQHIYGQNVPQIAAY